MITPVLNGYRVFIRLEGTSSGKGLWTYWRDVDVGGGSVELDPNTVWSFINQAAQSGARVIVTVTPLTENRVA